MVPLGLPCHDSYLAHNYDSNFSQVSLWVSPHTLENHPTHSNFDDSLIHSELMDMPGSTAPSQPMDMHDPLYKINECACCPSLSSGSSP